MSTLETSTNRFAEPDLAYRAIIRAHRGLTEQESVAFNARLVLILSNQIGDLGILQSALDLARDVTIARRPSNSP